MYLNRIVVLLTPVFAGLAGWVAQLIADNFPGAPSLDADELTAIFISGALVAAAAAHQWLKGWAKHEENQTLLELNGTVLSPAGEENREEAAEEGVPQSSALGLKQR